MAMLLDTWMARASVSCPRWAWASVIRRVRPVEVTGMFHTPFSPDTASAGLTRPRMSSAAAVNSLAVEPGSNGSVKRRRAGHPAARRLPGCQRQQLARVRVEEDDVAALGVHLGDGVVEPALGDLLQLGVDA